MSSPSADPPKPADSRVEARPSSERAADTQDGKPSAAGVGRLLGFVRAMARDAISVARGRSNPSAGQDDGGGERDPAAGPTNTEPQRPSEETSSSLRVRLLHNVTETLRGAADGYITAKLDEIEARVDAKLDDIEQRIDQKVAAMHEQIRELRDQEVLHRLRLLKLTLVFTVIVAALSLGYRLLVDWFG